jgi:general secretion pathway protein N
MPAPLLQIPKQLILVCLVTFCGLARAVAQQVPESEITVATPPPQVLHVANGNLPDLPINTATQDSVADDNPLWSIPLASLPALRERPIFSPTRRPRPSVIKPTAIQAPLATQPLLALIGAIAGENEGIAFFLDGTTKGVIRLKTGETHAGWTLRAVKPREAFFQNEQKSAVLTLPNPPAK